MPIEFDVQRIQAELTDFEFKLDRIDMQSVKMRTVERTADAMAEMVRQAVIAEDDINAPALTGPYERGKGPSMATHDAWSTEQVGPNRYIVTPHPSVRQRAIVLNYGYPGTITPNTADYLRFTIDGVPVYRKEVEGPDATGYWQAAYQRMESSEKLERIANEELEKEFDEVFR